MDEHVKAVKRIKKYKHTMIRLDVNKYMQKIDNEYINLLKEDYLANTIFPPNARPAAVVIMSCSAIPQLKNLSGNAL